MINNIINRIKSLDKGTLLRSISFIAAYINQIVAIVGRESFADASWYQIASLIMTLCVSAICAWKNNDFTYLAQLSGKVLKALKDKKITDNEIEDLLKDKKY